MINFFAKARNLYPWMIFLSSRNSRNGIFIAGRKEHVHFERMPRRFNMFSSQAIKKKFFYFIKRTRRILTVHFSRFDYVACIARSFSQTFYLSSFIPPLSFVSLDPISSLDRTFVLFILSFHLSS